ncbi:hypothetical protein DRP77_12185 [Candidatus Poribacteria bacterium]|nr:MAG: hypothetical protein DRP77_12185 [Candidatus Poribacteria bacterium]
MSYGPLAHPATLKLKFSVNRNTGEKAMAAERFELRLPSETLRLLRHEAKRRGISVAQLIREAIDLMLKKEREERVKAAQELFKVGAPVGDWEEMKKEIEEGKLKGISGGAVLH